MSAELSLSLAVLLILVIILAPLICVSACIVGGRADRRLQIDDYVFYVDPETGNLVRRKNNG